MSIDYFEALKTQDQPTAVEAKTPPRLSREERIQFLEQTDKVFIGHMKDQAYVAGILGLKEGSAELRDVVYELYVSKRSPAIMKDYVASHGYLSEVFAVVSSEQSYIAGLARFHGGWSKSKQADLLTSTQYALYQSGSRATQLNPDYEGKSFEHIADEVATLEAARIYITSGVGSKRTKSHAAHMYNPLRQMAILAQLEKQLFSNQQR